MHVLYSLHSEETMRMGHREASIVLRARSGMMLASLHLDGVMFFFFER